MICMCKARRGDAMNKHADPQLVWLASVLAAAVFIVYVTHI